MKLGGFKVIDLSWFLPGPFLTMTLADHGAEVIKVEPPNGDPGRAIGPSDGPTSVFFRNLNRGKKSVVIDLKTAAGREALLRLCDSADVVVESFRPGVAARLGIGYDVVSARNPGIVYCSISAFGQNGTYATRPAHDLALEAVTGVLSLTLGDDNRPAIPGIPIADHLSALQGLSGVLMALLRRAKTGRGDYLDIAMHDCLLAACVNVVGPALLEGRQPIVKHQRATGGSAFYRIFDTGDGRQLVLAGQEPKFIHTLGAALPARSWSASAASDRFSERNLPATQPVCLDDLPGAAGYRLRASAHPGGGTRRSQSERAGDAADRRVWPAPHRAGDPFSPGNGGTDAARAAAGRAHGGDSPTRQSGI